jgi:hypothetical protein
MISDAIRKGRSTLTSKSNVLQAPHYDQKYPVDVASHGYTVTKFSLQTVEGSCYVTLYHNDKAVAGATDLRISPFLLQVELAEVVLANEALTLVIASAPDHGILPTTEGKPPPPTGFVPNISYTLWLQT